MRTVFILGAGASVEAGAPTMADFLQRAKLLHTKKAYGADSPQIQDVIDAAYKDLKPVQVKSTINYKNIEELFSAIDIGQLIQCFGSRPQAKIDELRKSIVVFIYRTIEEMVQIPLTNGRIGLPKGYDRMLSTILCKLRIRVNSGAPYQLDSFSNSIPSLMI